MEMDVIGNVVSVATDSAGGWRGFTESQVKIVADAIRESASDNWLKDYIFPIFSALFAALLGGGVAVWINRNQELAATAKERVKVVNKLLLESENILNSLNSLKAAYIPYFRGGSKAYRVFTVPMLRHTLSEVNIDVSDLGFILPKKTNKYEARDWNNVSRINAMFGNYQMLTDSLATITQRRERIDEIIKINYLSPRPIVSVDHLRDEMGAADFAHYLLLYEYFVKLNDDLIIEFKQFLTKFGQEMEQLIGKKMAQRYGLIVFGEIESHLLLDRCEEPIYVVVADELRMTVEELKQRMKTGYPVGSEN
jgi:hypothetical protein